MTKTPKTYLYAQLNPYRFFVIMTEVFYLHVLCIFIFITAKYILYTSCCNNRSFLPINILEVTIMTIAYN